MPPSPLKFSIIVPVYNRRGEVAELLDSLERQTDKNFETIIVEDGSTERCQDLCEKAKIDVKYFYKENKGRSIARNHGMERADGDYFIFVDSDCVLPENYVENLRRSIESTGAQCYGGPDTAHKSFTPVQKAINYAMTSFLTTGGIRGRKKSLEKFTPRTFNMGFSRKVYEKTGGFREMFSEDIDMSLRIRNQGFDTTLFPDVKVYHKRRVSLKKFWKQVHVFGMSRITLQLLYPGSMKAVHWLPALFTMGSAGLLLLSVFNPWALLPLGVYSVMVWGEATVSAKSLKIGTLAVPASLIQLTGYGSGFIRAYVKKIILGHGRDIDEEIRRRKGQ